MNPPSTAARVYPASGTSPHVDGRTARRDRNRATVLDAVIELFEDGNLSPGVHEIAHRSGISLRSVYRYFDDVDSLIAAAIDQRLRASRPAFSLDHPGDGPLHDRVTRFCQARVALFEDLRVVYNAATVRSGLDQEVADGLARLRRALSNQMEQMFATELDLLTQDELRMATLTLDLVSQFDSLVILRETRQLTVEDTVAYLVDAFVGLLG
ncbi:MAG: TetR/AcrR family transcriptional regulator [Acidimicrobiales bacterium]|nr:TetR/AcrR family transcriptional regulator [Acidimicrobiales bacterium]